MPRVYVLSGPGLGRSADLGDGAVLGRGEDCDLVLPEASVSRRHARLVREPGGWALVDLGSRNGIGTAAGRLRRVALEDGAEVRLGKVELRVRIDAVETRTDPRERGAAPPGAPDLARTRAVRRAAFVAELGARDGGLLGGELEQRPLWQRLALLAAALALAVVLAALAFRAVQLLRAG